MGLYPRALCLCSMWQVGVSNSVDCCRVVGWWTPIFFLFVCLPVFREWMGRACGVVVRKFVFRIVDGTGMFSVSS